MKAAASDSEDSDGKRERCSHAFLSLSGINSESKAYPLALVEPTAGFQGGARVTRPGCTCPYWLRVPPVFPRRFGTNFRSFTPTRSEAMIFSNVSPVAAGCGRCSGIEDTKCSATPAPCSHMNHGHKEYNRIIVILERYGIFSRLVVV
jgi:hypothetical protein